MRDMEKVIRIEGRSVVLARANVDTDQVIPARFLKTTARGALGDVLFADLRRNDPAFPLDAPGAAGATVLVAGDNFGCGSSREHAAWALVDAGFRAVVSTSIADIFRANALKNGLVPVVVPADAHARLLASPGATVAIDLGTSTITLPGGDAVPFPIDPFARHCLVNGIDELGYLLALGPEIATWEMRR